jgi:hypothetical protein
MTDADARKAAAALKAIRTADTPKKLDDIQRRATAEGYASAIARALEGQRALLRRRGAA